MNKKDKDLLLKDLSARLPYGVIIHTWYNGSIDIKCTGIDLYANTVNLDIPNDDDAKVYIDNVKPNLRPMSSMTEEEIEEYRNLSDEVIGSYGPYHHEFIAHCVRLGIKPDNPHECVDNFLNMEAIDWLNAHHFDYRVNPSTGKTLIESGLAIEAPEGMYKTE